MHPKSVILAVILATEGILTSPSRAVPVVKKLGDPTNSNFYSRDSKDIQIQRAPALRTSGATIKPTTTISSSPKVVSTTPKASGYIDSARRSGLHKNLATGLSSKLSSSSTTPSGGGSAVADLTQRIVNLEEAMSNKQEALDAGDGIIIDGKTISVSDDLANLPTTLDEINQEIDNLHEMIDGAGLSDDYWTADETQNYLEQNYYTKEYVNQIVNQIRPEVVNDFDPGFLHTEENQGGQP